MAKRVRMGADECFIMLSGLETMAVKEKSLWGFHDDTIEKFREHQTSETVTDEDGEKRERKAFIGDCFLSLEKGELQQCKATIDWYAQNGVRGVALKPIRALEGKIDRAIETYDKPAKKTPKKKKKPAKRKR